VEAYLLDWLNLLLRWAHVIVAIAWIGSSFYFVFLDNSLVPPQDPALVAKGVDGELWAVHGGGFYNPQKYFVAPGRIPDKLHWFYWESYSTWLTGFALFAAMYLWQAGTYLIDPHVHAWSPAAAIAAALGFLVVFWLLYDMACRTLGQRVRGDRNVGIVVVLLVIAASWLACQLFAGRAAFLLVGAMLATAMTANVAHWIIPGQRKVIAQMKAGQPVDPVHGQRAKQRSVHNTYFTLPVVAAMLSNHYGVLHGARHNGLVLVALMAAGALIRHSFVARHKALVNGWPVPWGYAIAGCLVLAGLVAALAPAPTPASAAAPAVSFTQVQRVIEQRCVACHNAVTVNKNVQLHTPALIAQQAQPIYQQAVVQKRMPLNNVTQMTDAERALLARWYESGAKSD
jgi:uncharacterized membrane protein